MLSYTVYLDQVFCGNLIMNYLILWATAKISRTPAAQGRLAAGAAVGAAYALTMFIPGYHLLFTVWFKMIASVMITALVFAPLRPKKFLFCLGVFYLNSFLLGGLILGIIFYLQPVRMASVNGAGWLIAENFWFGAGLGAIAFAIIIKWLAPRLKKQVIEKMFKYVLFIKSGAAQVRVDAFLDTGNQLIDPMTRRAVIVAEYSVLKPLLPAAVQVFFEREEAPDVWQVLGSLGKIPERARFSVIPFRSLGHAGGLMVGFRPDQVSFTHRGRLVQMKKVIVAIYHKNIDPGNAYNALMHPRLLEMP